MWVFLILISKLVPVVIQACGMAKFVGICVSSGIVDFINLGIFLQQASNGALSFSTSAGVSGIFCIVFGINGFVLLISELMLGFSSDIGDSFSFMLDFSNFKGLSSNLMLGSSLGFSGQGCWLPLATTLFIFLVMLYY